MSPYLSRTLIQRSRGVNSPASPIPESTVQTKFNPESTIVPSGVNADSTIQTKFSPNVVYEQQIIEVQTQDESKGLFVYFDHIFIASTTEVKPLSSYIKLEKYENMHKTLIEKKLKLLKGVGFELDLTSDIISNYKASM